MSYFSVYKSATYGAYIPINKSKIRIKNMIYRKYLNFQFTVLNKLKRKNSFISLNYNHLTSIGTRGLKNHFCQKLFHLLIGMSDGVRN